MDRRRFIRQGTLGASALAAGSAGCAPTLGRGPGSQDIAPGLAANLERFDLALSRIDQWPLGSQFADLGGDTAVLDDLGKKSIKTLYASALFRDLPMHQQLHPAAQERMWALQPTMDEAFDGMDTLLRAQTRAEGRQLQRALRARPDVVPRFVNILDGHAAVSGLGAERRSQFREQVGQVVWRLENQPPELIVGEYLTKVEKVVAGDVESAAMQRWLASSVGEEAFWQEVDGKRERRISRGLRNMGIGAIVGAASGLLLLVGQDVSALVVVGAIGATVGAVYIVLGLVRVIMGLLTSPDEP